MGINKRITSPQARFLAHPEKVEAWLGGYSKDNPAKVSQEMFDAIIGNPFLDKVHSHVVVQDGREPDLPVHLRKAPEAKGGVLANVITDKIMQLIEEHDKVDWRGPDLRAKIFAAIQNGGR